MNIHFYTLGCKVNQYETQSMREILLNSGFSCNENLDADIIVINSCTVTAESDRKTRQLVRRHKRKNNNAIIVLTGCMVQAFPKSAQELIEADIVFGNNNTAKIAEYIEEYLLNQKRIIRVDAHKIGENYNTPSICDFSERTRANIKIEDGCERYCTYCIIPTARGPVRSRTIADIKSEAQRLAEKGYSEIVLVGINLSAYGKDSPYNLCDAVEAVCEVDGILRVRLGSLEPDHITDEMLIRFKAQEKFCPQFHLSLQSGCDETLKRMNRHYDGNFYKDLVSRIRNIFPNAAITTDIMVGFAGESDEEFNKSLDFVKAIGFARAHIFAYSIRSGTIAAGLKSQVERSVKDVRSKLMLEATKKSEDEFLKTQIGTTVPVLFETVHNGFFEGYTPNYTRVAVMDKKAVCGKIFNVYITDVNDDYCIGRLI